MGWRRAVMQVHIDARDAVAVRRSARVGKTGARESGETSVEGPVVEPVGVRALTTRVARTDTIDQTTGTGRAVGGGLAPTRVRATTTTRGNGVSACGPRGAPRRGAIAIKCSAMNARQTNTAPGWRGQVHLVTHTTPGTWRPAYAGGPMHLVTHTRNNA